MRFEVKRKRQKHKIRYKTIKKRGWAVSTDVGDWRRSLTLHDVRMAPANAKYGMGPTIGEKTQGMPGIDESQLNQWQQIIVSWNNGQSYCGYQNYNETQVIGDKTYTDKDGYPYVTVGGFPGSAYLNYFIDGCIAKIRIWDFELTDQQRLGAYRDFVQGICIHVCVCMDKKNEKCFFLFVFLTAAAIF